MTLFLFDLLTWGFPVFFFPNSNCFQSSNSVNLKDSRWWRSIFSLKFQPKEPSVAGFHGLYIARVSGCSCHSDGNRLPFHDPDRCFYKTSLRLCGQDSLRTGLPEEALGCHALICNCSVSTHISNHCIAAEFGALLGSVRGLGMDKFSVPSPKGLSP